MSIGAVQQGGYGAYYAGYPAAGNVKADAFDVSISALEEKAEKEGGENVRDAGYYAGQRFHSAALAAAKCSAMENKQDSSAAATEESAPEDTQADLMQFIREYMEQIFVKIQNGDTEPKYQIGDRSFTEKEWEKLLKNFDTAEEAIQAARKEASGKKTEELLTSEATSCSYPTADPDDEDIRYITWYTEEGIFCRQAGQTEGYEWTVSFENREQYDRVMELLARFPSDYNFRFAAHENFWQDFLNGGIDEESFLEFMEGTDNGIPDYGIGDEEGMRIDEDKIQWAPYFNQPGAAQFYTAEEMREMTMKEIEANASKLTKLTDFAAYADSYRISGQVSYSDLHKSHEKKTQGISESKKQTGFPVFRV